MQRSAQRTGYTQKSQNRDSSMPIVGSKLATNCWLHSWKRFEINLLQWYIYDLSRVGAKRNCEGHKFSLLGITNRNRNLHFLSRVTARREHARKRWADYIWIGGQGESMWRARWKPKLLSRGCSAIYRKFWNIQVRFWLTGTALFQSWLFPPIKKFA